MGPHLALAFFFFFFFFFCNRKFHSDSASDCLEHVRLVGCIHSRELVWLNFAKRTVVLCVAQVRAVAWCPGTVSKLAVGCREGVMVWDIGQKGCIANSGPDVRRLVWSGPTVATLREFAGEPSHTLAWHPSGCVASPLSHLHIISCASPQLSASRCLVHIRLM